MSSTCRRNSGFTLLEVLVALMLLVILSGALYGTYFSLMRGREAAVEKMEARRELSATLDQLRRELSSVYFNTTNTRLHFVVEDRDYFGKPASTLDFTAIAPPRSDSLIASDQVRLTYKAVEKEQKLLLARQAQDLYVNADPLPYPQMKELEGFLVECSADGAKWVRTWDTKLNAGQLPKAVRVTIRVREGEKTVDFSAIVKLRMAS
ncbi:MAG TPA: GspJ family type II secretion system protein [Geobacteraceae bacterium]